MAEPTVRQLAQKDYPVYYFYSLEPELARRAAQALCTELLAGETENTVLPGAAPDVEAMVMAAGTISFFGTRRLVYLPEIDPSAYSDKDLEAVCDLLASAENAVFVLAGTVKEERGKPAPGKRTKKLLDACQKVGYVRFLEKPTGAALRQLLIQRAQAQNTALSDPVARVLVERCGEDMTLLENEVDKLCAVSGYGTITAAMVAQAATANLEADVFEMTRLVTAKNATGACQKLQTLLFLQNEPIQIAGALSSTYVDLYRAKLGQQSRRPYNAVFSDFGYKGSPYRFKYVYETASHYTLKQLENCLSILLDMDRALKGGSAIDQQIELETTLCRLCLAGGRK